MQKESNYSINFIVPYFGVFPNYFQLFLNSCNTNEDINWTIITDNTVSYDYPDNVHVINDTFEHIKQQIQEKFDFEISLNSVHKLCEFKPAYGYIFTEYVCGYDFWGYCDIDVIYGNLRNFLTDEVLGQNDKLFTLGHLSLIKNDIKCNTMFMKPLDGRELYKEAFSSPENYNFDEQFLNNSNINLIFKKNNLKIYECNTVIADIFTKSSDFRLTWCENYRICIEKKKKAIFKREDNRLIRYELSGNQLKCKEYMYIHLQKRKMKISKEFDLHHDYIIIPNRFENNVNIVTKYNFSKVPNKSINLQYFRVRSKNLLIKIKKKKDMK